MVEDSSQIDRGYVRLVENVFGMRPDASLVEEIINQGRWYNRIHPDEPLLIATPEQILTTYSEMREIRDKFQLLLGRPDLIPLLNSAVDQAMSSLLGYEQRALRVRFGFGQENSGKIRLPDVGKRIYDDHLVTGDRARQIIAKALRKMRHPTRSDLITAVLNDDRLNEAGIQA